MKPYCGGRYRVQDRVKQIIDERSGQMIHITSDCLILDGVVCSGHHSIGVLVLSLRHLPVLAGNLASPSGGRRSPANTVTPNARKRPAPCGLTRCSVSARRRAKYMLSRPRHRRHPDLQQVAVAGARR